MYTPDSANGKNKSTIDNDEVEVTAFVRVLKDPTGVLWHNFVKWVVMMTKLTPAMILRRRLVMSG